MSEVMEILIVLDENPTRFLRGRCEIAIRSQKCVISRDYIAGGIVVYYSGKVFEFGWDAEKEKWFKKP